MSGWMGGREEEGEGTHLHFPDWESQGGETTHSLWNPGRSLGWIVDVFLRSTQPPSMFCIWRPLMLPSNGRCGKGEKDWGPSGRSELFWDSWPWVAIIMKIMLTAICHSCSICVGGDMKWFMWVVLILIAVTCEVRWLSALVGWPTICGLFDCWRCTRDSRAGAQVYTRYSHESM